LFLLQIVVVKTNLSASSTATERNTIVAVKWPDGDGGRRAKNPCHANGGFDDGLDRGANNGHFN